LCGAETWALQKVDHNYRNILKGRRKSVGPIVWEMKNYTQSKGEEEHEQPTYNIKT